MMSIDFPDRFVLTTKGVKNINDVYPGDCVYEWRTGNELEIQEIVPLTFRNMYELTYSDGRKQLITDREAIYLDQAVVPPHSPFCKCLKTKDFPIRLYPLEFNSSNNRKISVPLIPDPYIAGALIIHGDLDDPYMNWPWDRKEANNYFSHAYNIDYFSQDFNHGITNNKAYFRWKGKYVEEPLLWKDFFTHSSFKPTDGSDKLIPDEYFYTKAYNRVQFLRGAFDMGYNIKRSPHTIKVYHKDQAKLEIVRTMLFTLGVSSVITEEPYEFDERNYSLEIQGLPNTWPGFFYDYDYIVRMVNKSYYKDFRSHGDESNYACVTLVDIKGMSCCDEFIRNPVPHILLNEHHMVYMSENYLPLVSI